MIMLTNFKNYFLHPGVIHSPILYVDIDDNERLQKQAVEELHSKLRKTARETSAIVSNISNKLEGKINSIQVKLSTILSSVADAVVITDNSGYILEYNISAEELFKNAEKSMSGMNIKDIIPGVCFEHNCKLCCVTTTKNMDGSSSNIDVSINHIDDQYVYIIRDRKLFT